MSIKGRSLRARCPFGPPASGSAAQVACRWGRCRPGSCGSAGRIRLGRDASQRCFRCLTRTTRGPRSGRKYRSGTSGDHELLPVDNQFDVTGTWCGSGCKARHRILIRLSGMVWVVVGVHVPHARQPTCPREAPAERSSVHLNRWAGQTSYSRDERTLGGIPLGLILHWRLARAVAEAGRLSSWLRLHPTPRSPQTNSKFPRHCLVLETLSQACFGRLPFSRKPPALLLDRQWTTVLGEGCTAY
jgi:hypothetical protein